MISIDITALEELQEEVRKAASDAEEALALLSRTIGEMQDDLTLQTYEQTPRVMNAASFALTDLQRGSDKLQLLKDILLSAETDIGETEHENIHSVQRLREYLNQLQTRADALK